jgi:hypothetical protein
VIVWTGEASEPDDHDPDSLAAVRGRSGMVPRLRPHGGLAVKGCEIRASARTPLRHRPATRRVSPTSGTDATVRRCVGRLATAAGAPAAHAAAGHTATAR